MALVNRDGQTVTDFSQVQEAFPLAQEAPGFTDALGAAFRTENLVGSMLSDEASGGRAAPKLLGYNSWDEIQGTKYENYYERFADSYNPDFTERLKRQIDREEDDRKTIQDAGAAGIVSTIAAGVVDLPTLIPGGAIVQGGRGVSVARSALSVGLAGFADSAVTEIGLQQSQNVRGFEESVINIGTGTILSGMLGAAVGKAVGRSEVDRLTKSLENDLARTDVDTVDNAADLYDEVIATGGTPQSVGAAKVEGLSPEDYAIRGKAADKLAKVAPWNPMIQLIRSPSLAAREVVSNLPEMGFAQKMTGRGESQPQAVETYVKQWTLGAVGSAVKKSNDQFLNYRKQGGQLTRDEFNERVGKALRRNDADPEGDPFITQTAKNWRADVFEPLKDEAINAGLLPKDVDVSTAASYFTRSYNTQKIVAQEHKFRNILNAHFRKLVAKLEVEGEADFANRADFDSYVDEATTATINKILGREASDSVYNIVPMGRGPLKERTLNIKDEEIEEFLENNVELVGRQYARVMAADVELTRKFGRADMQKQLDKITSDYTQLRKQAEASGQKKVQKLQKQINELRDKTSKAGSEGTAESRAKKIKQLEAQKANALKEGGTLEKTLKELNRLEKRDIKNVNGLRDRLRGTHLLDQSTSNTGRIVQGVNTFNYLRSMGGVTISSVGDVGRHVMVHGFQNVMQEGLAPLINNLKAVKLSRAEAQRAGAAAELLNNSRMATMAELTDPYAYGHPVERWMNNAATGFTKLTGMLHWNDFQKSFAGMLTQNRVLKNAEIAATKGFDALPKKEQSYMAFLGLGRGDAEQVGRTYAKYGEKDGTVYLANTDKWITDAQDGAAKRMFYAAINKDIDSTIVTKGIGDTPLFADSSVGKMLLQFKSFALASHQRVLIRAAQDAEDAPLAVLSGMATQIAIGAMIYYLKSIEAGRDVSDNPGKWVAEGVDRSGLFAVFMEMNNIAEKIGAPGLYTLSQAAFPERDQKAPASRYATRSTIGSLLGPSFGLANDVASMLGLGATNLSELAGVGEGQDITKGDISAARRLAPGSTLPVIRSLLEYYAIPAAQEELIQ